MGNSYDYRLSFSSDATNVKKSLAELQSTLAAIAKMSLEPITNGDVSNIQQASEAARELSKQLNAATNVNTGKLDLGKLSINLKKNNQDLSTLVGKLTLAGSTGEKAFTQLADRITNAQLPLKQTSKLMSDLGTTLKNTVKWQLSSNLVHGLQSGLSQAWGYAKNLNTSLNDIRIVTGASADEMSRFAINANKAAKQLSSSTLDYTKASLIYYQQGDNDSTVAKKAAITIKAANASTESDAKEMSEYLTAVWNSYKVGSESLESFADVMAALGAKTATSMEEIAAAMEKVASVGNSVGVKFTQLSSIIATVSSVTRQSAESIGTSYKTIFARIADLKLGKTDEDGIGLGAVSSQLDAMGFKILDENQNLRNMGTVVEEIGTKWQTMNKATQTALAQAIAGKRQYTQLVALFDNWDKYQQNMNFAENSDGALQKMQNTYAESWEAASKRVQVSLESIYTKVIDDKAVIGVTDLISDTIDEVSNLISAFGGMPSVLGIIGTAMLKAFQPQIINSATKMITNLSIKMGAAQASFSKMQSSLTNDLTNNVGQSQATKDIVGYYDILAKKQQELITSGKTYSASQIQDIESVMSALKEEINLQIQLNATRQELAAQTAESTEKGKADYINAQLPNGTVKERRKANQEFDTNSFTDGNDIMVDYFEEADNAYVEFSEKLSDSGKIATDYFENIADTGKGMTDAFTNTTRAITRITTASATLKESPLFQLKTEGKLASLSVEQVATELEHTKKILSSSGAKIDFLTDLDKQLADKTINLEQYTDAVISHLKEVEAAGEAARVATGEALEVKGFSGENIEQMATDAEAQGVNDQRSSVNTMSTQDFSQEVDEAMKKATESTDTLTSSMVNLMTGVSSTVTGFSLLSSAITQLGDSNVSTMDKVVSLTTGLMMFTSGLLQVMNNLKAVKTAWVAVNGALQTYNATLVVSSMAQGNELSLGKKFVAYLIKKFVLHEAMTASIKAQTAATQQQTIAQEALNASNPLGWIAIAVSAIAAIIGVMAVWNSATAETLKKQQEASEKIYDNVNEENQVLEEQTKQVRSSYATFKSLDDARGNSTEVTNEYTSALDSVLEALDKEQYKVLATTGQYDALAKAIEEANIARSKNNLQDAKENYDLITGAIAGKALGFKDTYGNSVKGTKVDESQTVQNGTKSDFIELEWLRGKLRDDSVLKSLFGDSEDIDTLMSGLGFYGYNKRPDDYNSGSYSLALKAGDDKALLDTWSNMQDMENEMTESERSNLFSSSTYTDLRSMISDLVTPLLSSLTEQANEEVNLALDSTDFSKNADGSIRSADTVATEVGNKITEILSKYTDLSDADRESLKTQALNSYATSAPEEIARAIYNQQAQALLASETPAFNADKSGLDTQRSANASKISQYQDLQALRDQYSTDPYSEEAMAAYKQYDTNYEGANLVAQIAAVQENNGNFLDAMATNLNDISTAYTSGVDAAVEAAKQYKTSIEEELLGTSDLSSLSEEDRTKIVTEQLTNQADKIQADKDKFTTIKDSYDPENLAKGFENRWFKDSRMAEMLGLDKFKEAGLWKDRLLDSGAIEGLDEQALNLASPEQLMSYVTQYYDYLGEVNQKKIDEYAAAVSATKKGEATEIDIAAFNDRKDKYTTLSQAATKSKLTEKNSEEVASALGLDTETLAKMSESEYSTLVNTTLTNLAGDITSLAEKAKIPASEYWSILANEAERAAKGLKEGFNDFIGNDTTTQAKTSKLTREQLALQAGIDAENNGEDLTSLSPHQQSIITQTTGRSDISAVTSDDLYSAVGRVGRELDTLSTRLSEAGAELMSKITSGWDETTGTYKVTNATDKEKSYFESAGIENNNGTYEVTESQYTELSAAIAELEKNSNNLLTNFADGLDMTSGELSDYLDRLNMVNGSTEKFSELEEDAQDRLLHLARLARSAEKGFENLSDTWSDNYKSLTTLNKGSNQYSKALTEVTKDVKKMFGNSSAVTERFVEDHLDEIGKMVDGDKKAAQDIETALIDNLLGDKNKNIVVDVDVNGDGAKTELDNLGGLLSTFGDDYANQEIGFELTANDEPALAALNNVLASGKMTAAEMTAALNTIGWDPKIEWDTVTLSQAQDAQQTGYVWGSDGQMVAVAANTQLSADTKVMIPRISGAKKTGGGASSASHSTPSSGGGGGGGGSKTKKEKLRTEDEVERYHEVEQALDRVGEKLDKIDKMKERTYGKKHIAQIDAEIAALQEEIDVQEQYLSEANSYAAADKADVTALGATFDENGNINNYAEVMGSALDTYNAAIERFNNSAKGEGDQARLDAAKQAYDDAKTAIDNYEESLAKAAESEEALLDLQNQISQLALEKITYKVEIQTTLNDSDLQILEYFQKKYEEVLGSQDEMMSSLMASASEYEDNLSVINSAIATLNAQYAAGTVNEADYVSGMEDLNGQLLDNLNNLEELNDSIKEVYGNTLSQATSDLEAQTNQMARMTTAMQSYITLLGLMGHGTNYEELQQFYDAQYTSNMASIQTQRAYYEQLLTQEEYFRQKREQNGPLSETEQAQYDALEETITSVHETLMDETEQTLSTLQDAYQNTINAMFKSLDEFMAGTEGSLANLADNYSYFQETQERYVSTSKELYEVSKLNRQIEQSISDSTTVASKAALKALQAKIDKQSELNELTEYDIEMNQLEYQLALAQIALDEAKSAKDTVRLTRDENGNYAYQYTANQEKLNEAEQQYEDVLQQINELAGSRISELEQSFVDAQSKYQQAALEIASDMSLTEAERAEKLATLSQQYNETLLYIQQQYGNATEALGSNQEAVAERYGATLSSLTASAAANVNSTIGTMIQNTQSYIDHMTAVIGPTGTAQTAWQSYITRIQSVSAAAGTSYDEMTSQIAEYATTTQQASAAASAILSTLQSTLPAVNALTSAWVAHQAQIQTTISYYERLTQQINASISAMQRLSGNSSSNSSSSSARNTSGVTQYATGGLADYTGPAWLDGSATRPELVLNSEDTENTLATVESVRKIDVATLALVADTLNNAAASMMSYLGNSFHANGVPSNDNSLEQNVEIHAEFPNATNHTEIEEAFDNLINRAAQYANRKQ